jgi:hypothetical protein
MSHHSSDISQLDPSDTLLRLFVAGNTYNSRVAQRNLEIFCLQNDCKRIPLEIIDVCASPSKAMEHGVMITPTLEVHHKGTKLTFYGNLQDTSALKNTLSPTKPLEKTFAANEVSET